MSVGIDLVDVREVAASIARFGDRYLSRVYTPDEIAYAFRAPADAARRLGARFAAKEAALKTLGARDRGVSLRAIEVVFGAGGAPELALHDSAEDAARDAGVARLSVSCTHEGDWAAAVVVAHFVRDRRSRLLWNPRRAAPWPRARR